jgi:hypothetical protein
MNLESTRARRTLAVFGILWNATIVVVVLISAAPVLWKAAAVVYGGFAVVLWVSLGLGETIFRAFGCGRTSRFLSRLHSLRSVRLSFDPNRRARMAEATIPRVLVALVLQDLDVSLVFRRARPVG